MTQLSLSPGQHSMAVEMCVCVCVSVNFELGLSPAAIAKTHHVAHWRDLHIHVERNHCVEMYTHVLWLCPCDRSVGGNTECFLLGVIKDFMWILTLPS